MTRRFHKHKLLLDENFPPRSYFPNLNGKYDLKHLTTDLNKASLPDPEVYKLSQKQERIIVTYNIKDFVPFLKIGANTGVIGVSPNLSDEQIDKKLTALLMRSTKKALLGKLTTITGESEAD